MSPSLQADCSHEVGSASGSQAGRVTLLRSWAECGLGEALFQIADRVYPQPVEALLQLSVDAARQFAGEVTFESAQLQGLVLREALALLVVDARSVGPTALGRPQRCVFAIRLGSRGARGGEQDGGELGRQARQRSAARKPGDLARSLPGGNFAKGANGQLAGGPRWPFMPTVVVK